MVKLKSLMNVQLVGSPKDGVYRAGDIIEVPASIADGLLAIKVGERNCFERVEPEKKRVKEKIKAKDVKIGGDK